MKVRVTRMVYYSHPNNCLGRDVFKGEEFYLFQGHTYGCVSNAGAALSTTDDRFAEFFEFPSDAIEVIND